MEDGKEESLGETDRITVENNSSGSNHVVHIGSEVDQVKPSNGVETEILTESSPQGVSPAATKGYGLKKWRRIRRDSTKEGGNSVDSGKILKRGLPNTSEPGKSRDPVDSSVRSPPPFSTSKGSSLDSRLAVGYAFPADSENSEDRSSKSSTAASAPKMRFNTPVAMGSSPREKNKVKSANGKSSSSNSLHRSQLGKGKVESSKKFRGEKVKMEQDASYSSVESDLRSTSVAFGEISGFSGIVNGIQRERSLNYDGENSCEAQASDQLSNEDFQTSYCKDNGGEADCVSQDDEAADVSWEAKEEESDNQHPTSCRDLLAESIISLQDVQEALEKEIQKFGEIGKEDIFLSDEYGRSLDLLPEFDSTNSEIHETYSGQFHSGRMGKGFALPLESELVGTHQKVHVLEKKLEEVTTMLGLKESRILELEFVLNKTQLPKGESGSTLRSLQEECREMELKLEDLFRKKVEAEVECLTMMDASQKLKVASEDQIAVFKEQKSVLGEQKQVLHNLIDEKSVAKEEKEVVRSPGDTVEVGRMHNSVCKHALFLFIQLILLVLVLVVLFLQLPSSGGVVPT